MRRFSKTLWLVEKINDEAAISISASARGGLDVAHLGNPGLSSAKEHDLLLYIKTAAAYTLDQKQNSPFHRRAFYSCFVSLLQELKNMHRPACEQHSSTFEEFPVIGTPQTTSFSLSGETMYVNTTTLVSLALAMRKGLLTACAKSRAYRAVGAAPRQFTLEEEQPGSALVAERGCCLCTVEGFCCLRLGRSRKPSCLHLKTASVPFRKKKSRHSFPYGQKFLPSMLECTNSKQVGLCECHFAESGRNRAPFSGG